MTEFFCGRFQAFASSVIYAIQQLLPDNDCIVREPGEDDDFVLALADLEKLQPTQLNAVTCWLEKQVADMSRLAASPVQHLSKPLWRQPSVHWLSVCMMAMCP